jgi:hypothetical protein
MLYAMQESVTQLSSYEQLWKKEQQYTPTTINEKTTEITEETL